MTTLPPELAAFSDLLDAQPAPVRDAFSYCLCMLMAQAGVMRLVEKVPGENGTVCVCNHKRGSLRRDAAGDEQGAGSRVD
jgi:hypothetical protein